MRRKRESTAKGHGSPPLLVKDVAPVSEDQYPTAKKHEKKGKGRKVVNIILPNVRSVSV